MQASPHRPDSRRRWTRRAARWLHGFLAVAIAWSGPGPYAIAWAQSQDVAADVEASRTRLSELFGALEQARAALDRTTFDLEDLAFELAFEDPPAIAARVHELVRYEPYDGLLRGPRGTLASGGGNALDQAVLVARLLVDAGYDVEVRGASLDDAAAHAVLGQVRFSPRAAAPVVPDLEVPSVLGASAVFEAEAARRMASLEEDAAIATAALAPLLGDDDSGQATLLEEARAYHWVAYRLGPQDPWTEVHPLFGAASPPFEVPAASSSFQGEVPAELLHRLRFQVFLERKVGDELEVVAVTDAWERPVANLYGVPLSFANVPDGLAAVGTGDVLEVQAETSFFFPMFEGDPAPGAMAFDLTGATVPPDAAGSPFGALFQSLGSVANQAAGVLGGLGGGDGAAPLALTAQWLEFTVIAPDGSETTHRRMVVDRIGPDARAAGDATIHAAFDEATTFEALQSLHAFMVEPGRYGAGYRTGRTLDAVLATEAYVQDVLDAIVADEPPPSLPPDVSGLEEEMTFLNLYALFDEVLAADDVATYRPAPALVVLRQGLDGSGPSVDVVANPRRSLRSTPSGPVPDALATLRAGVWETRTETLVLTRAGGGVSPAFAVLGAADGAGLRMLGPEERAVVASLPQPASTRAAIDEDLARGYRVLVPTEWDGSMTTLGWWRTDPRTGETLGRGLDGRGNAFVEYLTSFEVSITITAGFAVLGAHQCTKISDPRIAGCCLVQNVAMAGVGTAVGVVIGAALVSSAAKLALFGAMDAGYNVGGLFLPTFCPGG